MFRMTRKAASRVKRAFRVMVESESSNGNSPRVVLRRYIAPEIDELTGDPQFELSRDPDAPVTWDELTGTWEDYDGTTFENIDVPELLLAKSQVYLECDVPALVSDADDFGSRLDKELTGEPYKKIRVFLFDGPIYPMATDIMFVEYDGHLSPYKIISLRKIASKYKLDLERVDRG
jgi:hypothetical protein